jgi:hypothetical protein
MSHHCLHARPPLTQPTLPTSPAQPDSLSAEILCCLPPTLAVWLGNRSPRRTLASAFLFFAWETASALVPLQWKLLICPVAATLLGTLVAATADDPMRRLVLATSAFAVLSMLAAAAYMTARQ